LLGDNKKKWKNVKEEKRGTVERWAQSVERLVQETAIQWLVDNKGMVLEDIVPCQDGFMIHKELLYDGILEDIKRVMKCLLKRKIEYKSPCFCIIILAV
jgi:hypothetical protein